MSIKAYPQQVDDTKRNRDENKKPWEILLLDIDDVTLEEEGVVDEHDEGGSSTHTGVEHSHDGSAHAVTEVTYVGRCSWYISQTAANSCKYDDIIIWKGFLYHWPFVSEIHWYLLNGRFPSSYNRNLYVGKTAFFGWRTLGTSLHVQGFTT